MTSEQDPSSPRPLPVLLNDLSFEALPPHQENPINTTTFMKHQNEPSFEAQSLRNAFRLQNSMSPHSNKDSKESKDSSLNKITTIEPQTHTEDYFKNQQHYPGSAAKETTLSPGNWVLDSAKALVPHETYEKKAFDPFGEQLALHFSVSDPSLSRDRLSAALHGHDRHGRTASIAFPILGESDCLLTKYSSNSTKAEELVSRRHFQTISELDRENDPKEEHKTEENENIVKKNIRQGTLAAAANTNNLEQPVIAEHPSEPEASSHSAQRNLPQPQAPNNEVQNPNQVHINIPEVPVESQPQESARSPHNESRPEPSIYFRRIVVLLVMAATISMLLVFALKTFIHYRVLLILSYCYWAVIIADCLKSACSFERDRWRRREDIFKALDVVCIIITEVLIDLKFSGYVANCVFAALPFFVLATVYCCTTKAPDHAQPINSLMKFAYTFQVLLITLRIDNITTWDWRPVFLLGWLFLGIVGIYCIAYAILLVLLIVLVLFGQHNLTPRRIKVNFVGLLWHFLYYGSGIIGTVYLIGVWQALNGESGLLSTMAWLTLYYGVVLCIYTIVAIGYLKEFAEYVSRSALFFENSNNNNNVEAPVVNRKPIYKLRYQVKKRTSHFLMVSSTYFVPLTFDSLMSGKQRLEKTKELIMNLTNKGRKQPQAENVKKEDLQSFKKKMDKKFETLKITVDHEVQLSELVKQVDHKADNGIVAIRGVSEEVFANGQIPYSPANKSFISEGNITDYKEDDVFKAKEKIYGSEVQCIICFQNPANAISMRCGHGGFCYDCAIQAIRKKNVCVECREPIREIYKVDPQPKVGNIVQSYEVTRFAKVPIKVTQ